MHQRGREWDHGRGFRQPHTLERDERSGTGPNQNSRIERNDQVATALNRITDILERLVRVVNPGFMMGIDIKCDFLSFDLKVKTPTEN